MQAVTPYLTSRNSLDEILMYQPIRCRFIKHDFELQHTRKTTARQLLEPIENLACLGGKKLGICCLEDIHFGLVLYFSEKTFSSTPDVTKSEKVCADSRVTP